MAAEVTAARCRRYWPAEIRACWAIVDVLSGKQVALSNCPAGGDMKREVSRPSLGS